MARTIEGSARKKMERRTRLDKGVKGKARLYRR
jgi:hypothetical protein